MDGENDERGGFWKRRNPFFDLFEEFDRMDDMMDDMMKRTFEGMDIQKMQGKPMTYGFSMKIGPDGKPQIQEFGNMRPTENKVEIKDAREPLVDVIEREGEIDVLAELPGVEKGDIDVNATERRLTIRAPNFYKEKALPAAVESNDVKAIYKNGVLTVTLRKKQRSEPGKKVRVD